MSGHHNTPSVTGVLFEAPENQTHPFRLGACKTVLVGVSEMPSNDSVTAGQMSGTHSLIKEKSLMLAELVQWWAKNCREPIPYIWLLCLKKSLMCHKSGSSRGDKPKLNKPPVLFAFKPRPASQTKLVCLTGTDDGGNWGTAKPRPPPLPSIIINSHSCEGSNTYRSAGKCSYWSEMNNYHPLPVPGPRGERKSGSTKRD